MRNSSLTGQDSRDRLQRFSDVCYLEEHVVDAAETTLFEANLLLTILLHLDSIRRDVLHSSSLGFSFYQRFPVTDSVAPESIVTFSLPANLSRPVAPTLPIMFSDMSTSSHQHREFSESLSNLLLIFKPGGKRTWFALALQRFRTTASHMPASHSKLQVHTVSIGTSAVVVVILLNNIRGLPRELVSAERPTPRSSASALLTVSANGTVFCFFLLENPYRWILSPSPLSLST